VTVIPVFVLAIVAAIGSATALGGFVFSAKAFAPKASKLNPIKGMSRIFGLKALVELSKALLKFSLVAGIGGSYLYFNFDTIMSVGDMPIDRAIAQSVETVLLGALVATVALVLIALIDVPYQRYEFIKKLKMTKQEIKDEMKETDGNPQVKQRIRTMQRQLAESRMMEDVKTADVVITNPTHYAVALQYLDRPGSAPRLVAKGKDLTALRIRSIATEHDSPLFEAPPLARALYRSTEIGHEIPHVLYMAVARVLAYVFQLKNAGPTDYVPKPDDLDIPLEALGDEAEVDAEEDQNGS
jgi:flagellar biosynthetic protein FlhB